MGVPEDETGTVPVSISRVEPRFYGVTPASLALVLAGLTTAVAIVVFATGHWPAGLILLGVSALLSLLFVEGARRRPSGTAARSTAEALAAFRARAGVAAEGLALRGKAAGQTLALRRELHGMASLRQRLLFELGEAVYGGDEQTAETARKRVDELDRLAARRETEMREVLQAAEQRLERRRLEVQPTEIAEAPQTPQEPDPGELNPPEPARIPEPYPPPDEANPPQPAVIPEPGPAVIPEPGPEGPSGEAKE
jgi:hypothetical protein